MCVTHALGKIPIMDLAKSLDCIEYNLVVALLRDANASHGEIFNSRALRLTTQVVARRLVAEGKGFLTKTLPRLGKCLRKALAGHCLMNQEFHRFKTEKDSELPKFLGEFFSRLFDRTGAVLPNPDATCVSVLLGVFDAFYKYRLAYTSEQEHTVISQFVKTEDELTEVSQRLTYLSYAANCHAIDYKRLPRVRVEDINDTFNNYLEVPRWKIHAIRRARVLLAGLFSRFNPKEIVPRHGPGAVAGKQLHRSKFEWTNIASRITEQWPMDEYFYASLAHVCDTYSSYHTIGSANLPARVILVPKDSRGPRLISCEPVDFQWIQQGLRETIYQLVERHWLTKHNVFFTNQQPNQFGALLGSKSGRYATLDLKEASDRVSCSLVACLFPEHIWTALQAARSDSTVLPDGSILPLQKYAPMGSALCFPVMALSIWALLTAVAPDRDTRQGILVYGDDVIVPASFAVSAMTTLEAFGLKTNVDKSCFQGSFRESCGVEAFQGQDVTPTRIRAVWKNSPSTDVYESWISYANSYFRKRSFHAHNTIVEALHRVYGPIPDSTWNIPCPSLHGSRSPISAFRVRTNINLQKREYKVRTSESLKTRIKRTSWIELLRYFTESGARSRSSEPIGWRSQPSLEDATAFDVSTYTHRHTSKMVWRWRQVL